MNKEYEHIDAEAYDKKLEEHFKTVEGSQLEKGIKARSFRQEAIQLSKTRMILIALTDRHGGIVHEHNADLDSEGYFSSVFKDETELNRQEKIKRYLTDDFKRWDLSERFDGLNPVDLNEKNIEEYLDRFERFDREKAEDLIKIFYAPDDIRRKWNRGAKLQFGYITGKLLDLVINPAVFNNNDDFFDFLNGNERKIRAVWGEKLQREVQEYTIDHYEALQEDIGKLSRTQRQNPRHVIKRIIGKSFDLKISIKDPIKNINKDFYESYKAYSDFRLGWKKDERDDWIRGMIHKKLKERQKLTSWDEAFLVKKEGSIIAEITKPEYPLKDLKRAMFLSSIKPVEEDLLF